MALNLGFLSSRNSVNVTQSTAFCYNGPRKDNCQMFMLENERESQEKNIEVRRKRII